MAAGALQRQAEEGCADDIDGLRTPFGAIQVAVVGVFDREGAEREQARADAALEVLPLSLREAQRAFQIGVRGPQFVCGDLLPDERGVRLVAVVRVE